MYDNTILQKNYRKGLQKVIYTETDHLRICAHKLTTTNHLLGHNAQTNLVIYIKGRRWKG